MPTPEIHMGTRVQGKIVVYNQNVKKYREWTKKRIEATGLVKTTPSIPPFQWFLGNHSPLSRENIIFLGLESGRTEVRLFP